MVELSVVRIHSSGVLYVFRKMTIIMSHRLVERTLTQDYRSQVEAIFFDVN